jgi:hypothetical protein
MVVVTGTASLPALRAAQIDPVRTLHEQKCGIRCKSPLDKSMISSEPG